jgi:hypothetical protein
MRSDQNGQQVPSGNIEGLSGLLSAVLTQTSTIQTADNAVDSKASNLMAAALVFIALLGSQLHRGDGDWNYWAIIPILIMIGNVCMVMYLTRSQKYTGTVVDLATHRDYFAKDSELLLVQLIEDADSANDRNAGMVANKIVFLKKAVAIFLTGFALGIISLFAVA